MRWLQNYAPILSGLLKDQRLLAEETYRLIHFVVRQPVEEGLLLYNVLTRAVVLLSHEEEAKMQENPASVPELVAKWFAVPLLHDDRRLAQEVRAVGKMLQNPIRSIKTYTILTTTDCNARCFYCYEKGRQRIPMRNETALKVVDFILRNHPDETVHLRWFGGEPLYNKGVISLICRKLHDAGVDYRSSMVSNGYLFGESVVDEAVSLWNLKKVQITLDGTENVYNRTKAFIDPDGSPYQRVLRNIHLLLDADIRVSIRLNIDRHNADDLLALADILSEEFKGEKRLSVYSHVLFETGSESSAVLHTDSQRQDLFRVRMQLQEHFREHGLSRSDSLPHALKLNRCMADDDGSVLILPDGHLGKCEHFTDDHWYGTVDSAERNETVLEDFKRVRKELDACALCPFYPDCVRLSLCEEANHCYPEEREEMLQDARRKMMALYAKNEI